MRFFTSDHHFYHNNIIKFCDRPFKSVEEMNEMMVKYWNETVGPDDEVWHLGDFSLAFRAVEVFLPRLMGKKFLVAGNHDFCHTANKKSRNESNHNKWMTKYLEIGFQLVTEKAALTLSNGRPVILSHMPFKNSIDPDQRHQNKRPIDEGIALLCGHVHEKWKCVRTRDKGTVMLNVGVDQWGFKPVSEEQIIKAIEEKENGI